MPIPESTAKRLPSAIAELSQALEPATPRDMAVALDRLWKWARTFSLIPGATEREVAERIKNATGFYRQALDGLPPDLLAVAIQRVTESHQWHTLPKPAEVRSAVADDFARRQLALNRLKTAALRHKQGTAEPKQTSDQAFSPETQRMMDEWRERRGFGFGEGRTKR